MGLRKYEPGELQRRVQQTTAGGISRLGRRQVLTALENFKSREKMHGRSVNQNDLSRLQRELEATIRRQEGID